MNGIDRSRLARDEKEYGALLASDEDWFARTAEDVKRLRESRRSPLSDLEYEDYKQFADSLRFRDGGLVSGNYKPLMSLPLTRIFEVFESFGISRQLLAEEPTEREGCDVHLECRELAPGVCEFNFWSYCIHPSRAHHHD
ncbi:hypothetical protein ACH4C6_26775 [Streptomyces sp. NPDC017943]|uniref:hypothetical protein n=1 Tax=Streptomyces sp. NPDC017943 TaxID=3365019 RepID=UPI0037B3D1F4